MPPPILPARDAGRRRSDASGACRGKGQPVLGADLNRSELSYLLMSQHFLPRSVPNRHLRDTLGSKGFFRTSPQYRTDYRAAGILLNGKEADLKQNAGSMREASHARIHDG
jgi:hypothetical protein